MGLWLFSSGDGESNVETDQFLLRSVGNRKSRLTFIPTETVDVPTTEVNYYYDEFVERVGMHGYRNVGMLALDRPYRPKDLERAVDSELIYLSGGNTFHFLDLLRRTGFDEVLRRRAESGMAIAGHSAGAIVLTPNIHTASYPEEDRDDNEVGLTDLTALKLVRLECFPHYESAPAYDNELRRASLSAAHPIYALPDGSCIEVDHQRLTFHGLVWAFIKGISFQVSGV